MNRKENFLLAITVLAVFALPMATAPGVAATNIQVHQAPSVIKLGGLFPLTGRLSAGGVQREAAARIAIEEINANSEILPNTQLEWLVRDTATDPNTGATAAQELIDQGVVGLIGAASSSVSMAIAAVAAQNQIPQISYSSTAADLSDKDQYPYFMRVVPPDSLQGIALAGIVKYFGWKEVATLATSDDYGQGGIKIFEDEAKKQGITVLTSQKFAGEATDIKSQLLAIKDSGAHVIVLNVIVQDAVTVFSQAADAGITGEGWVWIGSDGSTQEQVFANSTKIKDAMQGMIGTRPNRGIGDVYEHFLDTWESKDPNEYAGAGNRNPNTYATYAYDAVYTFAHALDKMINDGKDVTNGQELLNYLYQTDFTGATGPIKFNENGDRIGVYDMVNLKGDAFEIVGTWDVNNGLQVTGTIVWPGGSTVVPTFGAEGTEGGGFLSFTYPFTIFATFALLAVVVKRRK